MLARAFTFQKLRPFISSLRYISLNPFDWDGKDLNKLANEIEVFTKGNITSPPENNPFANLSREELSDVLMEKFNETMKEEEKSPVTKEQEQQFFKGVLDMHSFEKTPRNTLVESFKQMISKVDPEIPFYFDYQRPDYSSYKGKRRMTIGFCGESGVGKSTLINCVNNQSITKPSYQSTQEKCCFQGMHIKNDCQFLFYSMPNILSLKNLPSTRHPPSSFSHLFPNQLDAFVLVLDASKPLTSTHREMLYHLSDISFHQNIPLYIDLNKVDLVDPKPKLLLYSDAITEVIMEKREKLLAAVSNPSKKQVAWANEDIFMTSALENDGVSDLVDCFFKVASPNEWVSDNQFVTPMCSKEEVDSIIQNKLGKVYPLKNGHVLKTETTEIKENGDNVVICEKIMVKEEKDVKTIKDLQQKIEKSARKELTRLTNRVVEIHIDVLLSESI